MAWLSGLFVDCPAARDALAWRQLGMVLYGSNE
jgi:hypothetical protein